MASLKAISKTWIPYMNSKDCSQGFCTLYCPQWCYSIFPPPPPFVEFPDENSSPSFSPLFIAIIGILASAFLLLSYYTIISKYCGNNNDQSATRRETQENQSEELEDNFHNPSLHEPWHVTTTGLDESLIKSIAICKYKKGDGLIEGTDCSVCLSEFQEDESLRLLPNCSHAFHVSCIDTWLKCHSNCPLCRADIVSLSSSLPVLLPPPPPPVMESVVAITRDIERGMVSDEEEILQNYGAPKTPLRVFSDLGNLNERDTIIEIRNERYQHIRRSFSMDHPCQSRSHITFVADEVTDPVEEDCSSEDHVGSSKLSAEVSKSIHRRALLSVLGPVTMKRSISTGRFFLSRHGRKGAPRYH